MPITATLFLQPVPLYLVHLAALGAEGKMEAEQGQGEGQGQGQGPRIQPL